MFTKVGERRLGIEKEGDLGHYDWYPGNKRHAGISDNSPAPIFCRHVTVFVMNKRFKRLETQEQDPDSHQGKVSFLTVAHFIIPQP